MPRVRMDSYGRITIPKELRKEFGLTDGAIMTVYKKDNTIVLKPIQPLEPGEPVGEEEHKKLLAELEDLRRR